MAKRTQSKKVLEVVSTEVVKQRGFDELGATGLRRTGPGRLGVIDEEFIPVLKGERGRRTIREMRDNDPVVGAILFAIEMLLRRVTWRVEGEDEASVEFVESCIDDMSHTWEDFISEVLSMLPWGWSWHEVVYKRRLGDSRDPAKKSRFNDGKIGWRKMPIRAQDTLQGWEFDDEGGVQAFVQVAEPDFKEVSIPIERSLLFRTGMHKGNPEGRSILRNAYRPWYLKKHIEEIEAVGVERDLTGLPVFYVTAEIKKQYDSDLKDIIKNLHRNEQEGLILPLAYDMDGKKMLEFELVSSPGARQINTTEIKDYYSKQIAMSVLADFILLGQSNVGSWALSSDKTHLFATALGAILNSMAAVVNRYAIPRLLAVNSMQVESLPYVQPGDIETPNLPEIGAYITALAGAGAPLFPDDDLENYLREIANLPEKAESARPTVTPSQRLQQLQEESPEE